MSSEKVSLFNLPKPLLSSLNASSISSSLNTPSEPFETPPSQNDMNESKSTSSCRTCNADLSEEEFKSHFKSDWHRYNLKRKLLGKPTVSENTFEELEEVSSIDASDSEDESDPLENKEESRAGDSMLSTKGSPYVRFTLPSYLDHEIALNLFKQLSVYKMTLLPPSFARDESSSKSLWIPSLQKLQFSSTPKTQKVYWMLIMVGAGHFAGAVIDCRTGNAVAQKTFHRYTTRRKQGGAQSSNDSSKGNAKSAGAGLRRYNEAALQKEIQDLLVSWHSTGYMSSDSTTHIFLRVSTNNRSSIFFDKTILDADDERIRSFPFTTRRPSFQELKRCFLELTTVHIATTDTLEDIRDGVDNVSLNDKSVKSSPPKPKTSSPAPKKEEQPPPLIRVDDLPKELQKLIDFCKKGKLEPLRSLLWDPENDSLLQQKIPDHLGISALHISASTSHPSTPDVVALLLEAGADPTVHAEGRAARPYDVASNKSIRDVFRRHMAKFPDQWNYEDAHVPGPLTEEMELKQKEKDKERRKQEKEKKKASSSNSKKGKSAKEQEDEDDALLAEAAAQAKKEAAKMGPSFKYGVGGKRLGAVSISKTDLQSIGMTTQQRTMLDREKRALAAEARMRTNQRQCAACGRPLASITPFEKYNFKYCSLVCVQSHNGIF